MFKFFKFIEKIFIILSFVGIMFSLAIFTLINNRDENNNIHIGNLYFIHAGSDIFTSNININHDDILLISKGNLSDIHINNVISYYSSDDDGNMVIKTSAISDGYTDNNNIAFIFMVNDNGSDITISGADVIGKWNGNKLNNFYSTFSFIFSRIGFILIAGIPLLLLFIVEFTLLLFEYFRKKEEKNTLFQYM